MRKNYTLKNISQEKEILDRRLFVLIFLIFSICVAIVCRLIELQMYERSKYQTLSKQNQLTVLPLSPNRGLIYDRNGLLLADNVPVYSLEVTPEQVPNIDKMLTNIQNIIELSQEEISTFKKMLKQHRPFDPIPLKIEMSEKSIAQFAVNKYKYPGVDVSARLIRYYPYYNAFSHVLGYVAQISPKELNELDQSNYSASNFIGKIGIEKFYESKLHGNVGFQKVEADATGRIIRSLEKTPPVSGKNLHLTIDARLQNYAYQLLDGEKGALVAIEPSSGEILTMVSSPSYDPNEFVRGLSSGTYRKLNNSEEKPLFNRAIRGQYPLASTIKPFLALYSLEKNALPHDFKIWDPGWFKLPNSTHVYRDWKRSGHGWVDLKRSIIISCDLFYYNLANTIGIDAIKDTLSNFGFGQRVSVDIHEELPGLVASPIWKKKFKHQPWFPGDTLNSGIGQGYMLSTPLQLANATAILANRGVRLKPHLVKNIGQAAVEPIQLEKVPFKKTEAWEKVISAMQGVITSKEGTGGYRFGRRPPYTVAAKTGTAQVFSTKQHDFTGEEIPEHLRDHSLFIAFAPAKKPKIAIGLVMEHNHYASKVARKFLDYYLINLHGKA